MPAGGAWQAPVVVSPEGDSAFEPQVAFDAQGNALVLWDHVESDVKDTYEYVVQSAFRPAGGTWHGPANVSALGLAGGLHVAFDGQGDATAAWDQWSDGFLSPRIVQAAVRPANGAWQTPVDLTVGADELDQPKGAQGSDVAMDGQGDAVAVWVWEFDGVIQAAFRPANGAWGAPVNLSAFDESARDPDVTFDGQGDALAVWVLESSGSDEEIVQAALKPAGGVWQPPVDISGASPGAYAPQAAFDEHGDALVAWNSADGVQAAGYVASGPILNDVSIPTEGAVGQPLGFSVSPLDVWSVLGDTRWSFGDGATATGTSVTHTYTAAGTYEVTLRSADVLGNTTSASGTIKVTPAPLTPAPSSTPTLAPSSYAVPLPVRAAMRPTIMDASQSAATWREGGTPPVGTTFSVSLNEQATVSFSFVQRVGGHMIGHKCAVITSKNTRLKTCERALDEGALSFTGHTGMNKLVFQGRISRLDKLKPGRYTLTITATNSAGASTPTSLSFTIAK